MVLFSARVLEMWADPEKKARWWAKWRKNHPTYKRDWMRARRGSRLYQERGIDWSDPVAVRAYKNDWQNRHVRGATSGTFRITVSKEYRAIVAKIVGRNE
jgi:hypothetical protein